MAAEAEASLTWFPVVDPHHHLFQWTTEGFRKAPTEKEAALAAALRNTVGRSADLLSYTPRDLQDDANYHGAAGGGVDVVATVHVEAGHPNALMESRLIRRAGESVVSGPDVARGAVAKVDFLLADRASLDEAIAQHQKELGTTRLKGFRLKAASLPGFLSSMSLDVAKGFGTNPVIRASAKRVGELGYSVDVWIYHTQLDQLVQLVEAVPGTTFVVDHIASPVLVGVNDVQGVFRTWEQGMARLAKSPNVVMKLGGLCMNVTFGHLSPSFSSAQLAQVIRPWVVKVVNLFGSSRCCFESNFPMDKSSVSYVVLWNAYVRVVLAEWPHNNAELLRDLFFATANRTYRLGLDVPPLEVYERKVAASAAL